MNHNSNGRFFGRTLLKFNLNFVASLKQFVCLSLIFFQSISKSPIAKDQLVREGERPMQRQQLYLLLDDNMDQVSTNTKPSREAPTSDLSLFQAMKKGIIFFMPLLPVQCRHKKQKEFVI